MKTGICYTPISQHFENTVFYCTLLDSTSKIQILTHYARQHLENKCFAAFSSSSTSETLCLLHFARQYLENTVFCCTLFVTHSSLLLSRCTASNCAFEAAALRSDLLIFPSESLTCFEPCFVRLHRSRKAPYANLVHRRSNHMNGQIDRL